MTNFFSIVALMLFWRWSLALIHPSRRDDGADIYQLSVSRRGKFWT